MTKYHILKENCDSNPQIVAFSEPPGEAEPFLKASDSMSIIVLLGLTFASGISSRARTLCVTLTSFWYQLNVFQERTVTIRRQTIGGFGLSIKVI